LNSEPNGGGFDKEYGDGGYGTKVGGGSKVRSNGSFRRGESPDPGRADRSRDSPLYGKYPGHREERDLRRAGYGGRKEGERERDRSPRETKNNYSNYERKEKERKAEMEARAAALERARTLDRGIDRGPDERRGGLEGGRSSSGLERRVNSHLNHASTASSQATGFGDWTEHRSSNGKNYYYNITTEVSQWEKPREWVEHEKAQARLANPARDSWGGTRAQGTDRGGTIPTSRPQGTDRGSGAVARSQGASERGMSDRGNTRGSNNQLSNCDTRTRGSQEKHGVDERPRSSPSLHGSSSRQRDRKMELRVSSAINSHDSSGSSSVAGSHLINNHTDERSSLRENNRENRIETRDIMRDPRDGREGRETSREAGNSRDAKELRDMSAVLNHRVSESNSSQGDATPTSEAENEGREQEQETHPGGAVSLSAAMTRISSQPHSQLSISTQPGPGPGSRLSQLPNSYPVPSPLYSPTGSGHQDPNHLPSPSVLSPSLQSKLALHSLPPPLQLTPSLSRLYRENLIGHVLAWPAEQVERCCGRIAEETHQISSHGITKVSADLKMARSLVRLAEIQATLQEQRILFLRQQVADLDRVDRPVTREMSRDRDTLTREGLQHRDQQIRESLLQGRDPQQCLQLQRAESRDREMLTSAPRDSREGSRQSQSLPREMSREHSRDATSLSPAIPSDNFQSPSALSHPR